jgi:penicillin-insensitive murein endopeptidase
MRVLLLLSLLTVVAEASRFHAVALPPSGPGWLVPRTWADRGLRWGTPELVGLLQRAARRVHAWDPSATLYIGDLSMRDGSATRWHHSHRRGVDADVLLFAADADGRQKAPPAKMQPFARGDRSLDVRRNWLLTKALVSDLSTQVRVIFLANWIKRRLLDDARLRREDKRVLARAERLVVQPSDSGPHDDHLHVRVLAR